MCVISCEVNILLDTFILHLEEKKQPRSKRIMWALYNYRHYNVISI